MAALGRLADTSCVADAVRLTLLVAEKERARFERTALRWFSLYCHPGRASRRARAVLAALAMLPTERAPAAARAPAKKSLTLDVYSHALLKDE
jgi:hypothetical protein